MSAPVAFITGGVSGLGRALSRRFAKDGYKIMVGDLASTTANDKEGFFEEIKSLTAVEDKTDCVDFVPCDVRKYDDLVNARESTLGKWSRVDVVANNAGIGGGVKFIEDTTEELDWDNVMDINLMGVFRGVKAFTPVFRGQDSGHFINIASAAGIFNTPGMVAYNVAKAGVISLSETQKYELANQPNIGISVVCPGFFPTNIYKSMHKGEGTLEFAFDAGQRAMQKSKVSADDIASMCADAVKDKTFLIIPTPDEQRGHLMKRFTPELNDKSMSLFGAKLGHKWAKYKSEQQKTV